MFKKKKKEPEFVMDKNTTVVALTNMLHICRDQSDHSLSLEEIGDTIAGVLKQEEVQQLINVLIRQLKK